MTNRACAHTIDISQERVDETAKDRHGACVTCGALVEDQIIKQPKREWVGLTDEEEEDLLKGSKNAYDAIKRIEAKLKEKNI